MTRPLEKSAIEAHWVTLQGYQDDPQQLLSFFLWQWRNEMKIGEGVKQPSWWLQMCKLVQLDVRLTELCGL